ncbi:hypothetical protein GF382_00790 [Candidatus Falkowbacteria bacterium]|nr:hypothetical protein [Candidatus Falkowbacteria bacterium]
MKKFGKLILLFFVLSIFLLPISYAVAAEASLYVSPGSGTYTVGDTFNVSVVINSGGGVGINASDATITFDPAFLEVKKTSKNNSIFNLWTTEPSYSNQKGQITYSGGSPTAYKGSAGTVMSVTFLALKKGQTSLSIGSANVLAADGKGTNILKGASGASYTFEDKQDEPEPEPEEEPEQDKKPEKEEKPDEPTGILPPPPKISSPTHPEEEQWYSNNNPEFGWKLLSDISGISMELDENPETEPQVVVNIVSETYKYEEDVPDGVKYFHIKFKNRHGWGPVSHRKIQIDTTPPGEFEVKINNGGDPTDPQPDISFSTTDETSGIASYEFILDGEIKNMTIEEYELTPYIFPLLKPGQHELVISAIDRAGNMASSSAEFVIEPLKAPVITQIPRILDKNEELVIQGTSFYSNASIKVYITKDEEEVEIMDAKTDVDGAWSYFHKNTLPKGTYQVWAKIIDERGAESDASMRKVLQIKSPSLVCAYGWWIVSFLLLIILGLVVYILYLRKQFNGQRDRAIRETRELEQRLNDVFTALKEEVSELIEFADEKPGVSEAEKRVKNKITEALDISQEFIGKEIKDVEKEIG